MKLSVNDAKPGDIVYADDGREVGLVAVSNANEIGIEFDAAFGFRDMIRLNKARMDCSRSTLLLPMDWARAKVNTRLLHLSAG
jgi:hypothetical protein